MTWRRAEYTMNHGTKWAHYDDASENRIEQRVYRTGEKEWPRLTLTTWIFPGGLRLSIDIKESAAVGWYKIHDIPPELIDDAIEMLAAAKAKVR